MTGRAHSRGSTAPAPHRVTNTWQTAAIRCGGCGEAWEQPNYEQDGSHWVCPHCLHAAEATSRG